MAPRPTSPRLATLDPVAVATFVCRGLIKHEKRLRQLTSRIGLAVVDDVCGFPVYGDLLRLIRFAQTGDEGYPGEASTTLENLSVVYFGSAAWGGSVTLSGNQESMGKDAGDVGTVVLATRARLTIAARAAVHHQALAALAGVHPSRVLALAGKAGKGVLKHSGVGRTGRITAASARAWLKAKGVPGYSPQSA